MTRKLTAAIVLAALTGSLVVGATARGEEAGDRFPYWTAGATSESDNNSRISFVENRRDDIRERERNLDARIDQLKRRLAHIRATRHDLRDQDYDHTVLLSTLKEIRGDVDWLYNTRMCESGGDYGAHSDSGTYHGAYQDSLGSWGDAYGYHDPHEAPWYFQDARNAEIMHARGTGPWPVCG